MVARARMRGAGWRTVSSSPGGSRSHTRREERLPALTSAEPRQLRYSAYRVARQS